jgi:hypothetical protein
MALGNLNGGAAVQPLPTISLQEQLARLQATYATRVGQIAALSPTTPQSVKDYYNASLVELQNAINAVAAQLAASMANVTAPVQTVVSVQPDKTKDPEYYISTYIPPSAATQSPPQVVYSTPVPPAPIPLDNRVKTHDMQPATASSAPAVSTGSEDSGSYLETPGPADGAVDNTVDNSVTQAQDSVKSIPWGLIITLGLALFN